MVEDANITLTSLKIICNYIRDALGKRDILPEEAVYNKGTGYMETDYDLFQPKMSCSLSFSGGSSS